MCNRRVMSSAYLSSIHSGKPQSAQVDSRIAVVRMARSCNMEAGAASQAPTRRFVELPSRQGGTTPRNSRDKRVLAILHLRYPKFVNA